MRVRDVVETAVAEAPPLRWTADEIIDRSRRVTRRRHRRTAGLAAALAMIGVAGGLVGILREPPPQTVPQSPPAVVSGPFVAMLSAYAEGELEVRNPSMVSAAVEIAEVRYDGKADAGLLFLYRPGLFDAGYRAEGARPETIAGRTGWSSPGVLAWEYGDDAWAVLTARKGGGPSASQLRKLAEKLRPGLPRPVQVPVHVGYVPPGYEPFEVRLYPDAEPGDERAIVKYGNPAPEFKDLQGSWSVIDQSPKNTFSITVLQNDEKAPHGNRKGDLSAGELRKVLKDARVADLDNPSTWPPANQLPSGR